MRVYKTVFERDEHKECSIHDFLKYPAMVAEWFDLDIEEIKSIPEIEDKSERNQKKRDILPAANFADDGVFTIDIDNIYKNSNKKANIVEKLSALDDCLAVKESISGGLSAFFKFDCTVAEFPYVYYKKYLELTLLCSVNIDFLPDVGRLRYLSTGQLYHYNENSEVLTEAIDIDVLPVINANVTQEEGRRIIYGSR